MKCNFKLLSLYLDGGLGQRKREKLERHLQICESCAEKLEELKDLEAVAAREKLPQVSEAYWETFPARVRNKLLLREREPGSDSFWKKLQGTFRISPFRLKLAGAVATIIIAAWIGRLYIDYRPASPERGLPSQNLNLPQKVAAPAETTQIPAVSSQAEKDQAKSKESIKSGLEQYAYPPVVSPTALPEDKSSSVNKKSSDGAAPVGLPTEVVTAKKPVISKGETANLRRVATKDIEALPVKKVDEFLTVQPGFSAVPASLSPDTAGELHVRAGSAPVLKDTLSAVSAIKKQIVELEKFLLSRPSDSLQERAYQDLARSYLNLCQLTRNKKDIEMGLKRIQDIQIQFLYPSTRINLNKTLERLQALERSLE
ncbi:MAG: hypothetical protein A2Z27_05085 [candidate division Zixibacteria bacterium RBG_16_50_21]|nr:MAG: hypothetical protein A2Z27_05085 [candidate division Zixibacteria bacterium RBG_16_50_21]